MHKHTPVCGVRGVCVIVFVLCVSCVRVGGLVVKWMGECAGV